MSDNWNPLLRCNVYETSKHSKLYAIWDYSKGEYLSNGDELPATVSYHTAQCIVDNLSHADVLLGKEENHEEAKENGYLIEEIE